jgi:hypothetical protein
MKAGMMVSGIVRNEYHAFSGNPADSGQLFEKIQKSFGIELPLFPAKNEFAIAQSNSAEIPNAFARGMVQQDGVLHFGRHPHDTP